MTWHCNNIITDGCSMMLTFNSFTTLWQQCCICLEKLIYKNPWCKKVSVHHWQIFIRWHNSNIYVLHYYLCIISYSNFCGITINFNPFMVFSIQTFWNYKEEKTKTRWNNVNLNCKWKYTSVMFYCFFYRSMDNLSNIK